MKRKRFQEVDSWKISYENLRIHLDLFIVSVLCTVKTNSIFFFSLNSGNVVCSPGHDRCTQLHQVRLYQFCSHFYILLVHRKIILIFYILGHIWEYLLMFFFGIIIIIIEAYWRHSFRWVFLTIHPYRLSLFIGPLNGTQRGISMWEFKPDRILKVCSYFPSCAQHALSLLLDGG